MNELYYHITKCPICKEDISVDAVKCKHCHEWLAPEKQPTKQVVSSQSVNTAQLLGLFFVGLLILSGIFFSGLKAYKVVMASSNEPKIKTCSEESTRQDNGYTFKISDDPSKTKSQFVVYQDSKDCQFYIKNHSQNDILITPEIQAYLLKQLALSDSNNPTTITLQPKEKIKKNWLILDADLGKNLNTKIEDILNNAKANSSYTLSFLNSNFQENTLVLEYIPASFKMYRVDYPRQMSSVIYVKEEVNNQVDKNNIISSSNIDLLKTKAEEYIEKNLKNKQDKKLFSILDKLKTEDQNINFIFITNGEFSKQDGRYYDFNSKDFWLHRIESDNRNKAIKTAQEKIANGENVTVPPYIKPFNSLFMGQFGRRVVDIKNICFDLQTSGDDSQWLTEKTKLYKNFICK